MPQNDKSVFYPFLIGASTSFMTETWNKSAVTVHGVIISFLRALVC